MLSEFPYKDWRELLTSTDLSNEIKKYEGLRRCCNMKALTFKDLKEVVEKGKIQTAHTICKVRLK